MKTNFPFPYLRIKNIKTKEICLLIKYQNAPYKKMQQYLIIFFPAFIIGILHTFIPCEDKAIFFFWSSGISKNPKRSLFILALYGIGLMSANLIIAFFTILISLIPILLGFIPDRFAINFIGAFSSIIAGIIILLFVTQRDYNPHSKAKYHEDISQFNWEKNRTPYLFGILAGFPPCIFELFIYTQCLTYSLSYGYIEGILTVFFFSLGTFIGLYPLAIAKHSTYNAIKPKDKNRKRVFIIIILVILIFNSIIIILSILRIDIFAVVTNI